MLHTCSKCQDWQRLLAKNFFQAFLSALFAQSTIPCEVTPILTSSGTRSGFVAEQIWKLALRQVRSGWNVAPPEIQYIKFKGKYQEVQQMHSRISSSSMKNQKRNTTLKTNQTVALSSMPLFLSKLVNVTAKHRPSMWPVLNLIRSHLGRHQVANCKEPLPFELLKSTRPSLKVISLPSTPCKH